MQRTCGRGTARNFPGTASGPTRHEAVTPWAFFWLLQSGLVVLVCTLARACVRTGALARHVLCAEGRKHPRARGERPAMVYDFEAPSAKRQLVRTRVLCFRGCAPVAGPDMVEHRKTYSLSVGEHSEPRMAPSRSYGDPRAAPIRGPEASRSSWRLPDGPEMAPSGFRSAPRWLQDSIMWSHDPPKMDRQSPRTPQDVQGGPT